MLLLFLFAVAVDNVAGVAVFVVAAVVDDAAVIVALNTADVHAGLAACLTCYFCSAAINMSYSRSHRCC